GEEVARATSIVRYAPNSSFSSHEHGGGEEFFVLAGVFADEHGDYPAGTYVRNPVGTAHTPKIGEVGATILVKLHQFEPEDQEQKAVDTRSAVWAHGEAEGEQILPLHEYGDERVCLKKYAPEAETPVRAVEGGEEIFVLEGVLHDEQGAYPAGTWLRNPPGHERRLFAKVEGALIYRKQGHLSGG
ncbi:MAG: cupin domain-containing protein, partial [Verrucomicrobiota bacterium]